MKRLILTIAANFCVLSATYGVLAEDGYSSNELFVVSIVTLLVIDNLFDAVALQRMQKTQLYLLKKLEFLYERARTAQKELQELKK